MTADHGCNRCPARWTGSTAAHCSACHTTYGSVRTFDLHQTGRPDNIACKAPQNMRGVTEVRPGVFDVPRLTPRVGTGQVR